MTECADWIMECRDAFPRLNKFSITAEYKKMGKGRLGYVKGRILSYEEVDPMSIFLEWKVRHSKKTNEERSYQVFINEKLKKAQPEKLRKQITQNIMIHELMHIEKQDLTTKSKDYSRRKRKKIHIKEFHQECLERFNQLRKKNNLPAIKSYKHLRMAEGVIVRKLRIDK